MVHSINNTWEKKRIHCRGALWGRLWLSGMPSDSEAEGQQFKPDLGTSVPIWRLHGHRHEVLGVRGIIELL